MQDLVVGAYAVAGKGLAVHEPRQLRRSQEAPRELDAADHRPLIDLVRQVVWLDRRIDEDVGRFRPHVSNALGPMLPDTAAHARIVVEHADEAFLVARRRKHHLEVGAADVRIRLPEAVAKRRAHADHAGSPGDPAQHLADQRSAAGDFVDGLRILRTRHEADRAMVAEIFADRRQIMDDLDAEALQQAAAADAGELQEARRIDGAAADDHLFARLHLMDGPAALVDIANRRRLPALEHDPEGARMGANVDPPGLLLRRQEIHPACAATQTLVDAALEIADAGLGRAIVVGVAGNIEADGPGDERLADLVLPIEVGHRNVAVATAIKVVTFADPRLKPLEIGQEVGVAPARVAALRPAVELVSLAAVDDHAVDRAGSADRAADRDDDRAFIDVRRRLGLDLPSVGFIEHEFDEACRNINIRVPVGRTGLQGTDSDAGIFRQASGDDGPCSTGPDDDVIEG